MTPSPEQIPAPKGPLSGAEQPMPEKAERKADAATDRVDRPTEADPYKAIEPKREEKITQAVGASKKLNDAVMTVGNNLVNIRQDLLAHSKDHPTV